MSDEKKKNDQKTTAIILVIAGIGYVLYQGLLWIERHSIEIFVFIGFLFFIYITGRGLKSFFSQEAVTKRAYKKQQDEEAKKRVECERKSILLEKQNREKEETNKQLMLVSMQKQEEIKIRLENIKTNLLLPVSNENKHLMENLDIERQKFYKHLADLKYLMDALQNKKKELLNASEKEKFLWKN